MLFSSEDLAWAAGLGALALAGLPAERSQVAGKRVAVIQTGGNADEDQLIKVLPGAPPPCEGDRT